MKEDKSCLYDVIKQLMNKLFQIGINCHFVSLSDLCFWTISNFYFEFGRYCNNALEINENEHENEEDNETGNESSNIDSNESL